ncbi:endoplasmic reticulum lectin 1 isoform X1 [Pristis pectinata]|uniref:endoplasmic reticulum lectin 1 isoform X1 n=1 Tax=Pristis pectinata TaxID=685728 RepID=UPI00223CD11D|nr:endoplasmic reticulum lectin 1 isoform X1 [Pristis pectinata]
MLRERLRPGSGSGCGSGLGLLPLLLLLAGAVVRLTRSRTVAVLSDDVPFRITWPGPEFTLPTTGGLYKPDDFIIITTAHNERYKCMLPSIGNGDQDEDNDYKGHGPGELLEPLLKQSSCSYRIESYWTYEVCHGKHIRQYHEEKETGQQKVNIQEYYLGTMTTPTDSEAKDPAAMQPDESETETEKFKVHTKNIEGQITPYYPVIMGNGTPCSLKQNKPRVTTVMYVCHPEAKHEILSVAEVTTCEYELVILTPLLCSHPKYRFKTSPVNDIFCQSVHGSPLRPQSLEELEKQQEEMMKPPFNNQRIQEEIDATSTKDDKFATHKSISIGGQQPVAVGTIHISKLTDEQLIQEFLSGSYCFHGGVGWWKYEFCYGKHVQQYHEDKGSGKNIIVVGTWNKEEHITWAAKNSARSYQWREDGTQKVRVVSHFYGNGDLCDLTGKPRQVVVKLKCKESESPHAVTIYMLEPQTCQYILGVESPIICKILDTADESGLFSAPH